MVFSSNPPPYLDSSNWPQYQHHQITASSNTNPLLTTQPEAPFTELPHGNSTGTGSGSSSIRPGSMSERARMANIPIPEPSLKCPRCESTNTKFCYFNNYNLSQPRHFCKNCRRYWTKGGALRSVPIGGGCRRNKRPSTNNNKSTTKKLISPATQNMISTPSSRNIILTPQVLPPPLRFMSPNLNMQLTDNFSNIDMGNFINYSGVTGPMSSNLMTPEKFWAVNKSQFHFLSSSLDTGINYPFHGDELEFLGSSEGGGGDEGNQQHQVRPDKYANSVIMSSHFAAVKSERNGEMNNMTQSSRKLLDQGLPEWNNSTPATAWTHLSSFSSSIPAITNPFFVENPSYI